MTPNPTPARSTQSSFLSRLYLSRAIVQVLWAILILRSASASAGLVLVLVLLYPLWDVVCTALDLRFNAQPASRSLLVANAGLGVAAAVAIAVFGRLQSRYAIAVFGLWALLAGLLQLGVALARRRTVKGQAAMLLSGAQSALAGAAFLFGGLRGLLQAGTLGGYAIFGGIYFFIAALLLRRRAAGREAA